MDWLLLRSTWLGLLRGSNGVDAAMNSMRGFVNDYTDSVTPLDAFHSMWRLHCGAQQKRNPDSAALLLLLVTIGGLERKLASTLLISDPCDVAQDLKAFASVAKQWRAGENLSSVSNATWIQLLHVAAILFSSSATTAAAKERLRSLQTVLQTYGPRVAPEQECEDQQDEKSMNWDEFMALGSGLEHSALLRTKDGRRSAQELLVITTQQQSRLSPPEDDPNLVDAMEVVWEAAAILMKCCNVTPEPTEATTPGVTQVYHSFCDENAFMRHVHAASGDVPPLSPSQAQNVGRIDGGSAGEKSFTSDAMDSGLEDTFIDEQTRELEVIEDNSVLCIRVASLLGLQLQRGSTFVASVSSTRSSQWEQSVRKAVNSLTSVLGDHNETRQLLRLAAVHPSAVIDMIVGSALSSSQHHEFFNRLLLECPLLAKWAEAPQGTESLTWKSSILTATLSRVLLRIVSEADGSSPLENSAAFRFILHISTPTLRVSTLECASDTVVTPDACVRHVFWPALENLKNSASPTPVSRLFTLIVCFLDHVHKVKSTRLSSITIRASLETAIAKYTEHFVSTDAFAEYQDLQDSLLLITESLLHAWSLSSNTPMPLTSVQQTSIDVRMRCLLASHGVFAASLDGSFLGDELSADGVEQISGKLLGSIAESLWRLVWARDRPNTVSYLHHLKQVHRQVFVDGNRVAVAGASVIQNEVAGMLLSSGGRVFDRVVHTIGKYVILSAPHPGKTEPAVSSLLAGEEVEESTSSCETAQLIMEYVLRCWSVAALSSQQPCELSAARTLNKMVNLIDRTIAASTNPKLLLQCLQAAGFLYSWIRAGLSLVDIRVSNRIEVTATRILFLLKQIQSTGHEVSVEEAHLRSTAATVLVSSGLLESESIVSFLRSNN